jgi:hypothetical protein
MSQKSDVLSWLKRGKTITSWEAFERFGATRLSAIIFELKKDGNKIAGIWETTVDRYGDEKRFLRYFLVKKGDKNV